MSLLTKDSRPGLAAPGTAPAAPRAGQRAPWLMVSPSLAVIGVVTLVPIVLLAFVSFTDYDQRSLFTGVFGWTGVDQYTQLFQDSAFWAATARTFLFTAALVVGSVLIGAFFAYLLTRLGTAVRTVFTVSLVLAWAMPTVASSVVWNWLFQPGYGVANWILTKLHVFGDLTNTDWANDKWLAFLVIWLLIVWQAVPFIALTLYAALTQIPGELTEAARIDGAGEWRTWWSITMPILKPTFLLVTILSVIWDFNVFNQIWLVSGGGPGDSTSTLGVYAYKTAFVGFHVGQGAAIALVTTALLAAVSWLYVRQLVRSGESL